VYNHGRWKAEPFISGREWCAVPANDSQAKYLRRWGRAELTADFELEVMLLRTGRLILSIATKLQLCSNHDD
jgi:hypothetical protein